MFIRRLILLFIVTVFSLTAFSQDNQKVNRLIDNVIDSNYLKFHLRILASDSMAGRETGSKGLEKAGEYIAENLREFGLKEVNGAPGYKQNLAFSYVSVDSTYLEVGDSTLTHLKDYISYPIPNHDADLSFKKLYFAGYGISDTRYNDYSSGNFRNKAVIIFNGEPVNEDGEAILARGDEDRTIWSSDIRMKLEIAKREGVKFLFIIEPNFQRAVQRSRRAILSKRLYPRVIPDEVSDMPPHMYISPATAEMIFGDKYQDVIEERDDAREDMNPKSIKIKSAVKAYQNYTVNRVPSANIAALLPGKKGPDEAPYLILSAHYDHLGKRKNAIYNGADDNGTGSTALLSIADAFSRAKIRGDTLEQSILFLWMTGEEKGLLGSNYYSNNPLLPLNNASANVNVDMIGRRDVNHPDTNYIYVIGSDRISTELDDLVRKTHAQHMSDFELDYTFNAEDDPNRFYYRSDHYNFAKKGVPAVFFFSGVHEDYHRITDTVDKIMFPLYGARARFIAKFIAAAANREKAFERDVPQD